jgi:DNA polymerase III alpha subunit
MWINSNKDLITGILNHGPDILKYSVVASVDDSLSNYIERVQTEKLNYPLPITLDQIPKSREWLIPNEYLTIDIEKFLIDQCPKENLERLMLELQLFKQHNMLDVLNVMKYIVDTLRANGVVWGVGRGSSVASYALFLIGVHKIDSVKYKLPIDEFFKGENNG